MNAAFRRGLAMTFLVDGQLTNFKTALINAKPAAHTHKKLPFTRQTIRNSRRFQ